VTAAPRITLDDAIATHGRDAMRTPARHHCWRVGDLSYLLHEGQLVLREAWHASTARRYVGNIGRGWGKSYWALVECVELCTRTPNAQVRYAAPEQKMVETIIAPHMRTILEGCPPALRPVWKEQKGFWDFPNGAKLFVAGANAGGADRLRGVSTHLAVIDEARDIDCLDYLVKNVLTPRLTADAKLLIISTPPEMPDHALVGYIAEAQVRGAYTHAPTSDAPHITPERMAEFLEDYAGPDDPAFRREFCAEIIVDPTRAVLPELSALETMVTSHHERPAYLLPHVVGDLGYEDLTVIAFGYYDFQADMAVVERELVLQRTRSDLIDAEVTRIATDLWPKRDIHRRRIDAPPIVRADMGRVHVRSDDSAEPWQATRNDDLRAAANAARVQIQRGRVRIAPECQTILAHAKYARWNRQRTGLERPAEADHHYDGCAALLYFLRELDRHSNPWPKLAPGVHDDTHHIPEHLKRSEASKLRAIFGKRRR
jgi:hypothetical protein